MRVSILAAVVVVLVGPCVPAAVALHYEAVDLGTLGGPGSVAVAINNRGEVAGTAGNVPNLWGAAHAFLWTRKDGMIDLGPTGPRYLSYAGAMNDRGQVVGYANAPSGHYHAFVWSQQIGMLDIGTLGGWMSFARDINNSGMVVGTSYVAHGGMHAFVWKPDGGIRDLGTLPGGLESWGYFVNESGDVAGYSRAGYGAYHAFLWTQSKGMIDLGTLGGYYSEPTAMNNSGDIVGYSWTASGEAHGFFWSKRTGMVDIGTMGGEKGGESIAWAVNNKGQVVGEAEDDLWVRRAFLWSPQQGLMQGFEYQDEAKALAVNDSGLVAGDTWVDGHPRAFVWSAQDGLMVLPTLGGQYSSFGAMNDRGEIVGAAETATGHYNAVLWAPRHRNPRAN